MEREYLGKKQFIHRLKSVVFLLISDKQWFEKLQHSPCKIIYLGSLPFIGDITKYHLARNLGIDVAKPDRHLTRLAKIFHYDDVQEMCKYLSDKTGDRIGTVDVVLWRYCTLVPSYFECWTRRLLL